MLTSDAISGLTDYGKMSIMLELIKALGCNASHPSFVASSPNDGDAKPQQIQEHNKDGKNPSDNKEEIK